MITYDIMLVSSEAGAFRTFEQVQSWSDERSLRADTDTVWAANYGMNYRLADRQAAALERFNATLGQQILAQTDVGVWFDAPDEIHVSLAFRPEVAPHLACVVDVITKLLSDLGGDWIWVDLMHEEIIDGPPLDHMTEVFGDWEDAEPVTKARWRRILETGLLIVFGFGLAMVLTWFDGTGCADFEVAEEETGLCSVPCLEGESDMACQARAEALWEAAGIDAVVVDPVQ